MPFSRRQNKIVLKKLMKVFKFGGASVKDADAVKNIAHIVKEYANGPVAIVVSAMGKTTNALENLLNTFFERGDYLRILQEIKAFHLNIIQDLFGDDKNEIYTDVEEWFLELECYFERELGNNYDFIYDQVVSYGEIFSTRILQAFFQKEGINSKWIDARNFIVTDDTYREARINWERTTHVINTKLKPMVEEMPIITQGFIGSSSTHYYTTLGREGSDFTAAILANALDAEEIVIWKDVPGVLNADPKKFTDTVKFDTLSYEEAIEMTYYGATVLHPKTIKPLQNKNIPLQVRSFINPEKEGTLISAGIPMKEVPILIVKERQVLISFTTTDYSFIDAGHLSSIFSEMANFRIKMNLMSNRAISFAVCTDDKPERIEPFVNALQKKFTVKVETGLNLLTIRHYTPQVMEKHVKSNDVLIEQRSGNTVQFVLRNL